MSKQPPRLNGINPLAYLGVNPYTPPGIYGEDRNPTQNDNAGFLLGDFWLNQQTHTLWYLAAKSIAGVQHALWIMLGGSGGSGILTLTGNDSIPVPGDGFDNINVIGNGPYVFSGNIGTNTLSLNDDGTIATTYQADVGTASPIANVIQILGGDHLATDGATNIINIELTDFTNHALVVGNSVGGLDSLAAATNGQIPIGHTGFNPTIAAITAGAGITVTNGAGSITIAATGGAGVTALLGDNGQTASGNPTNLLATPTAGSSVAFEGDNVDTMSLIVTDAANNTLIGRTAGNGTISGTGTHNVGIGTGVGLNLGAANANTLIGSNAGTDITTGDDNTLVGWFSGSTLTTGNNNTIIGSGAGSAYTGAESSNILLANPGVLGESNVMRLGRTGGGVGRVNATYIGGVDGVNVGAVSKVLTMGILAERIGTASIVAGAGINVIPSANLITISTSSNVATSYVTVPATGTAIPAAGVLTFTGTGGTTITTAGSTVTINGGGEGGYEQGLWFPAVSFVGQTVAPTFSISNNRYVRVGHMVTVNGTIFMTNSGTAPAAGQLVISGFPFNTLGDFNFVSIQSTQIFTGPSIQDNLFLMGTLTGTATTIITQSGTNSPTGIGITWSSFAGAGATTTFQVTSSYIIRF